MTLLSRLVPIAIVAAVPFAASAAPASLASASLVTPAGNDAGYAVLTVEKGKVLLSVEVRGLSDGPHGLHLHTTGTCSGAGFAGAGGHLNPGGHQHGSLNPAGSHLGDLPNIAPGADGEARGQAALAGKPKAVLATLFDVDGTAIVIHAGPDDYKTDPTGNSGGRIACGVLRKN